MSDNNRGIYRYYSTQRPVDIGTFPKTNGSPEQIVNFDSRQPVKQGRFQAWGYLEYREPLPVKQQQDYELRASLANRDVRALMESQLLTVGNFEEQRKVPEERRLTRYVSGLGIFIIKDFVLPEQMEERYKLAVESHKRDQIKLFGKPSIAAQLKEGERQAEGEKNIRPVPGKDKKPER